MCIRDRDLKSETHRARHPLGRVPVLEDDGKLIWESGAIVEYILECHEKADLKPDKRDPSFPAYLQWFHYCEGMVMPPVNTIVVQTVLLPPDRRDETALLQAKKLLTRALEPVNTELSGRDYLIGNFSAADIMLGHACFMSNRLGCVPEEMSNLKRYVGNISSRPAFDLAINMQ